MLSANWQPFCLSLNVLIHCGLVTPIIVSWNYIIIVSGNDQLATKPFPESMLINHYLGQATMAPQWKMTLSNTNKMFSFW